MNPPALLDSISILQNETDPDYGTAAAQVIVFARIPAEIQESLPGNAIKAHGALLLQRRFYRVRMRFFRDIPKNASVILHQCGIDHAARIVSGPALITALGRGQYMELSCESVNA